MSTYNTVKISQLSASGAPQTLDINSAVDVIPIVSDNTTKKITVDGLFGSATDITASNAIDTVILQANSITVSGTPDTVEVIDGSPVIIPGYSGSISASGDGIFKRVLIGIDSGSAPYYQYSTNGINLSVKGDISASGIGYFTEIAPKAGSDGTPADGASITIRGQHSSVTTGDAQGGRGGDVIIYGGDGLPQANGIVRIGSLVSDTQTLFVKGRIETHQYGSDTGSMFEHWLDTSEEGPSPFKIVELKYERPSGSSEQFTQTFETKYPTRFINSASSYFFSGSITASSVVKVNDLVIDYDALPTTDSGLERGQVYRDGSGQLFVSAGS